MANDEDPTAPTAVYIATTHVVVAAGIFSVTAYDALGQELAHAPSIEGAKDWAEALAIFWAGVAEAARIHNAAPFN